MNTILICGACDAWTLEAHTTDHAAIDILLDHARACAITLATRLTQDAT